MAFDDDNVLMRDEIRRITAKLVVRVESVLEEPRPLSAGELDKLAGVLMDAAAVLGLRAPLDEEEQRAKIDTMLARLAGEKPHAPEPLTVCFEGDAEEFSR